VSDDDRLDRVSLEVLHWRTCAGEDSAVEEMCGIVLRLLRASLRRVRPDADRALVDSAAEDAILKYLANPRRFDPRRAGLLTWLDAIALRRLADFERPQHRADAHIAAGVDPARLQRAGPLEDEGDLTEAWIAEHRAMLLAAARTDSERAFVEARLAGAPRDVQAVVLGIAHVPQLEAREEMNRMWQLISRRARRRAQRSVPYPERQK
jgi:hypothetical protein